MADELLSGPVAGEILAVAVEAAGGRLADWRPAELHATAASYRVRIRSQAGERTEILALGTDVGDASGVTLVGDGSRRVGIWRAADDPALPGLRRVMDPLVAARLLATFGLGGSADDVLVRPRLRAYRPLRRAVVELSGRLFVKAVPPAKVRALQERHRLLASAGVPVPRSLGWTDDGLVVLEALPGRTLRTALRCGESVDPAELTAILDRLPAELLNTSGRSSWLERTRDYADAVGRAVPDLHAWASELAGAIVAESTEGPKAPVHGDFYEAQLLVDARSRISGLLDVDTAGAGDRLDDLGCLIGHLSVLSEVLPQHAHSIEYQLLRCLEAFDRLVDPRQLRLRTAAVVLSLATGPHRVQEPGWQESTRNRLALAERWYESSPRSHRLPHERNHHVRTA